MTTQPPRETEEDAPPARKGRFRTFDSLAEREYRLYFFAMFLYFAAMQMTVLARPWLAFDLSAGDAGERSFLALGITVATNNLPSLVLSPYAGVLADKVSKRNILVAAAVLMSILALVTAAGVVAGILSWWHVAIIGVGQGSVMTFITPTRRAIIPELVSKANILNATSLHTVTQNTNRTLMPLVAGFVIAGAGAEWAYVLIAGLYVVALVSLLLFVPRTPAGAVSSGKRGSGSAMEGFRYAMAEPIIRNLLLLGLVGAMFGQTVQHLLPMFQPVLEIGPAELGPMFTAMGIGSLIGSTTSASLGDFKRKGLLLIGFFMLFGAAIALFSFSGWYALSVVLMVPVGFGQSGRNAVHIGTLQSYTEPEMRGRVQALNAMQSGFMPIAVVAVTGAAEIVGPQWAMGASGLFVLAYGTWELLFSKTLRNLR